MKKILVAEDEQDVKEMLVDALRSEGYEVIEAENGYEALNLAREEKPDLIILDVMMPELDGWQTVKKLKESDETNFIPILISTAKWNTKNLFKAELGTEVDDILQKPYRLETLLQKVKKILEEI